MPWRPPDWEKTKPCSPYQDWGGESFDVGVEAGADAGIKAVVEWLKAGLDDSDVCSCGCGGIVIPLWKWQALSKEASDEQMEA